ncbi:MAG: energy-coupling factor transporter transmembrane component T [bacterium]|nr:energy-coupling factor transporter transmembrane component T [bacterium]
MPLEKAHALDPRFQVVFLIFIGLFSVLLDGELSLALLAAAGLSCALLSRPTAKQLLILFLLIFFSVWGFMFSQGFFYRGAPRTTLAVIIPPETPFIGPLTGGLALSYEGVRYGASQSLRIIATLSAGLAVGWSADPARLLAGLTALRMPHALAFCITTAVRFLPLTFEETHTALRAQRMRGLRPHRRPLQTLIRIARPVLAAAIRRSETVAHAAASRGYRPDRQRSNLQPLRMSLAEKSMLAALGAAFLFILAVKTLYFLYESGLSYFPALQGLYQFTREVL